MKEQSVSGDKTNLTADRLAIKEGLKSVSFSGILGNNLCFSGNDAELPGYVIQIKDQKWTLIDSHAPDSC
jgi:branched-chain amino acid transport system substrate-binding protein